MKSSVRVYNQSRWSLLILGLAFIVFSIYGLFNPESVTLTQRGGSEIEGKDEIQTLMVFLVVGIIFLLIRLRFMRYRKNDDFSSDVPLPMNVTFEKVDDASENIRRYKTAQIKARNAIKRKLSENENV
ncbi:hypothetical protein [Marinobacter salarius]|jgi:hypothetical protein|uniref:hypothetical protein n=1 Tax=Marinobacter salarius TaxID=1420917 RepID=UPI000F85A80C|nr:hypothetical protein [Marinobacter salarius]AZR39529.1 hypothetical protein MTMN5_00046 [Marinobacter salarius]